MLSLFGVGNQSAMSKSKDFEAFLFLWLRLWKRVHTAIQNRHTAHRCGLSWKATALTWNLPQLTPRHNWSAIAYWLIVPCENSIPAPLFTQLYFIYTYTSSFLIEHLYSIYTPCFSPRTTLYLCFFHSAQAQAQLWQKNNPTWTVLSTAPQSHHHAERITAPAAGVVAAAAAVAFSAASAIAFSASFSNSFSLS